MVYIILIGDGRISNVQCQREDDEGESKHLIVVWWQYSYSGSDVPTTTRTEDSREWALLFFVLGVLFLLKNFRRFARVSQATFTSSSRNVLIRGVATFGISFLFYQEYPCRRKENPIAKNGHFKVA